MANRIPDLCGRCGSMIWVVLFMLVLRRFVEISLPVFVEAVALLFLCNSVYWFLMKTHSKKKKKKSPWLLRL
jgi:hypothetical protein